MLFQAVFKGFPRQVLTGAGVLALAIQVAHAEALMVIYKAAQANDPRFRSAQQQENATGQQAMQQRSGYLPRVRFE